MAEKEARLASLTAKVEELQEALATAETQAAGRAADATQALASKKEEAQELRRRVRVVEEEKQACLVLGVLGGGQKILITEACAFFYLFVRHKL